MRALPVLLLVAACTAQPPADNSAPFAPGLERYENVFHDVPANGTLPDIGKADAVYPAKSTELLKWQSPVKSQGQRGVCTIFATTGLMESLYLKAGAHDPSFSEQYLQWAVKVELGSLPHSEGSNISDNVQAIHQFGIVDETTDPYNPKQWTAADDPACKPDGTETQQLPTKCWTQGDPPAAAQQAKKYFLPAGQFLNTSDIKAHITQDATPVAVGIDFFYQAWNHGLSTLPINRDDLKQGIVRYPNATDVTESHKHRAGHGILIVGWDDNLEFPSIGADGKQVIGSDGKPVMQKGFYIFKNSWGTTVFGVNNPYGAGYGYISEKYVEQYATAYVTSIPDLNAPPPPPPPPPTSCQYKCSDYGFKANQCYMGWSCDAQGACLSQTGAC